MANSIKGDVSLVLFEKDSKLERRIIRLFFTTEGSVAMEDYLDLEGSEIAERIFGLGPDGKQRMGSRLTAGLLLGATRRYHAQDLPSIYDVYELMDEIGGADDTVAETEKLGRALVAAYTKSNPDEIEAEVMGEESGTKSEAGPKETQGDQDKPKRKPRQKGTNASGSDS